MKISLLPLALAALIDLVFEPTTAFAQNWTQANAPITNWTSVASSADGSKLVAVVGGFPGGSIHTSTYCNGIFVARGEDGSSLMSQDAMQWASHSPSTAASTPVKNGTN